jgi:adenylylsulfate kinase
MAVTASARLGMRTVAGSSPVPVVFPRDLAPWGIAVGSACASGGATRRLCAIPRAGSGTPAGTRRAHPIAMTGVVVWFTGLPAAGKSTLAAAVHHRLIEAKVPTCVLDGDQVRTCMVPPVGYIGRARDAFYSMLARLAAMLARQGLVVLVPATAYRREYRDAARELAPAFIEVFVQATVPECAARDPKGLYLDAGSAKLRGLPGVDLEYEAPLHADVIASDGHDLQAV